MYLLYDLMLLAATGLLIPLYLWRGLQHGKSRRGIRERLGFLAPGRLAPLEGREVFWVHAVSVGETRAAIPLVKALKRDYPGCAVLVSNVTETGHAIAREVSEVDVCLFFPFDLSWVVRRVLDRVRPRLIAIVETEIWPNFVREAHGRGIPLVLVNGRFSDRSFPRYRRARFLLRPLLQRFSAFCMQSDGDARRVLELGAPPERVEVTRNLKFDMQSPPDEVTERRRARSDLRLAAETPVWVAGSTHAGEEEVVLDAFLRVRETHPGLVLVLVPRHPERCRGVAEMLAGRSQPYRLRSELTAADDCLTAGEVLLGDTLGEMLRFYAAADLVFVGGSLVPVGGHNVLEGALLRRAVLFGPHMHNFREISRLLRECGGGLQVAGGEALGRAAAALLDDPDRCRRMGERGYRLLADNAGATAHTLAVVRRLLER